MIDEIFDEIFDEFFAEMKGPLRNIFDRAVERGIADAPIYVKMNGVEVDTKHEDRSSGQVDIELDYDSYLDQVRSEHDVQETDEGQIVSLRRM